MSKGKLASAIVFAVLMASCLAFAEAWRPTHFLADDKPKVKLDALIPEKFGDWEIDRSIVPVQPSPDLQKVIDATYDQTLARSYRNSRGQRVMLSMAYGRNQHEGMNTHRPEICYPAQGLQIVVDPVRGSLSASGMQIPVTRVVARKGERNEPITYWLIVGDQITFFGGKHKLLTLEYGLRKQIPDGILVRMSSIDANAANAFAVHQRFAADLLASVTPAQRVQLLGKLASPA